MKIINVLIILCILFVLGACHKEPQIELPETVDFEQTEVYLNGDLINYTIEFQYISVYDAMYYSFSEQVENQIRGVGFSLVPYQIGDFDLNEDDDPSLGKGAYTSFSHTINEDLEGYTYKLVNEEDGFFEVTRLDTVNHIVEGRFKAEFKRTKKNGNLGLDLEKRLFFEGVFHEEYEVW